MGWVLLRRDGGSFFAFPSTRGIGHRASKLSCPGGGVHRFRGRAWGRARGVRLRVGARVSRRASPGMLSRGAPGILGSVWGSAAGVRACFDYTIPGRCCNRSGVFCSKVNYYFKPKKYLVFRGLFQLRQLLRCPDSDTIGSAGHGGRGRVDPLRDLRVVNLVDLRQLLRGCGKNIF